MISQESRDEIKAHALADYPKECCGFVVVTSKGRELVVRCLNSHPQPREFVQCSVLEQHKAESLGDPICFYHSHPDVAPTPTDADKASSEMMDLPWIVYATPLDTWDQYSPSGWVAPLIGRSFVYGVHDCFTASRDFYKQELNIDLPFFPTEDEWWKTKNLYVENFAMMGFVSVQDLKKYDVFLIQLNAPVPNHAAVYLGQNIIFHHVYGRLSCRAPYGGFWLKNTRMTLRHKNLL